MKTIIKYGVIISVLLVIWDFLLYNYLYLSFGSLSVIIQAIVIGGGLFLMLKEVKHIKGELTYKNASISGFLVSLTAAVIYYFSVYGFYPYGNLEFKNQVMNVTLKLLKEKNAPAKDVKEITETMNKLLQPEAMATSALINTLIIGIVLTLILSSIMRKKDQPVPL